MRLVVLAAAALAALAVSASAQTAPHRIERGALRLENVPDAPPEIAQRLRQYVDARNATFVDWLPNGGILITTRSDDTVQLHSVDAPMGEPRQLTFFEDRIT